MNRPPTLILRHWEKATLVLSLAVLAASFRWRLLESPNTISFDGRTLEPSELHAALFDEAQALEHVIASATVPSNPPPSVPSLVRIHEAGVLGAEAADGDLSLPQMLRRSAPFGVEAPATLGILANAKRVTPPPPARPSLSTGLAILNGGSDAGSPSVERRSRSQTSWVRVASSFGAGDYQASLLAAGYPPFMAKVYIARVEAQRQELLAGTEFSPWQDLPPQDVGPLTAPPAPAYDDQSGRLLNRDALTAAFQLVKASQERIALPGFAEVLAGDAPIPPPAVANGTGDQSIWYDDTGGVAGRIYRYRLRVRFWNRLVGRRNLVANASDADATTIAGEWSKASETIIDAPDTHLFVQGPGLSDDAVNFEVWRWRGGEWFRRTFEARVGDAIGGPALVKTGKADDAGRPAREQVDFSTGQTLLDARRGPQSMRVTFGTNGRFALSEQPGITALCLDAVTGRVIERTQTADRSDPVRESLRRP